MSRYERFQLAKIELRPIAERGHDVRVEDCLPLGPPERAYEDSEFSQLTERIVAARRAARPVILMMGAHPVKLGLSRFLVDLIERRIVTHLATNGAALIHDFELALIGGTSENAARWIRLGQFGLWRETSRLNDIIRQAAERDEGLGEAVGRVLEEERFPHRAVSLAAAGWRVGCPVTCHVAVGSDILHAMPNCDGAALGRASYQDFLIFARAVADLEGGVLLNVGTAVTGPEVFLKALSMARNVARQEGGEPKGTGPICAQHPPGRAGKLDLSPLAFTTAVFDLVDLPPNYRDGPPAKDHPLYYFRPWKTLLVRIVGDGGMSYYFRGDHRVTIPTLWAVVQESKSGKVEKVKQPEEGGDSEAGSVA